MAIKGMKCGHCGESTVNPDTHTCPESQPKPDYPENFIDALKYKAACDSYGINPLNARLSCPSCNGVEMEKKYYSNPSREYVTFSCAGCRLKIAESDTPYLNNPFYTEEDKNRLSPEAFGLLLKRIEKIEEIINENPGLIDRIGILGNCLHEQASTIHNYEILGSEPMKVLTNFHIDFGHRLKVMEDLVNGRSIKAIEKTVEHHIDDINDRMSDIEDMLNDDIPLEAFKIAIERIGKLEQLTTNGKHEEFVKNINTQISRVQDTCTHNNAVLCKDINKIESDLKNKDSDLWERVKRLEDAKPSKDGINILINGLDNLSQKMPRLEQENEHHCEAISTLEDSHKSIKQLIQNLIEQNQKKYASLEDELKAKLIAPMCDISREVFSKMYPNVSQTESYVMPSKGKPHKCPICWGDGNIYKQEMPSIHDKLFGWQTDAMGTAYKPCSTCDGKGIVWG